VTGLVSLYLVSPVWSVYTCARRGGQTRERRKRPQQRWWRWTNEKKTAVERDGASSSRMGPVLAGSLQLLPPSDDQGPEVGVRGTTDCGEGARFPERTSSRGFLPRVGRNRYRVASRSRAQLLESARRILRRPRRRVDRCSVNFLDDDDDNGDDDDTTTTIFLVAFSSGIVYLLLASFIHPGHLVSEIQDYRTRSDERTERRRRKIRCRNTQDQVSGCSHSLGKENELRDVRERV